MRSDMKTDFTREGHQLKCEDDCVQELGVILKAI